MLLPSFKESGQPRDPLCQESGWGNKIGIGPPPRRAGSRELAQAQLQGSDAVPAPFLILPGLAQAQGFSQSPSSPDGCLTFQLSYPLGLHQ